MPNLYDKFDINIANKTLKKKRKFFHRFNKKNYLKDILSHKMQVS